MQNGLNAEFYIYLFFIGLLISSICILGYWVILTRGAIRVGVASHDGPIPLLYHLPTYPAQTIL
jgi:hypothetical protein